MGCCCSKNWLDAIEDCSRHGHLHFGSQKKEIQTGNLKKQCYHRSTAKEHHKKRQDSSTEKQILIIEPGNAINAVDLNKRNTL